MGYNWAAFAVFVFFLYASGKIWTGTKSWPVLEPIRVAFAIKGVWELGGFQVPLGLLRGSLAGFKLWLPEVDAAVMIRSNIQQEGKAMCYVCAQPSGRHKSSHNSNTPVESWQHRFTPVKLSVRLYAAW